MNSDFCATQRWKLCIGLVALSVTEHDCINITKLDCNIVLVDKAFMVPEQLGAAVLEGAPAEVLGGAGAEVAEMPK